MKSATTLRFFASVLIALALLVFLVPPLWAQEEDITQLRQRITELEAKVKQLEAVIDAYREPQKDPGNPRFGWQNKMNWRRLQRGMADSQVKNILGEPIKVISGVKTLWYYPNIYCGYVTFDSQGRLIGWNEP